MTSCLPARLRTVALVAMLVAVGGCMFNSGKDPEKDLLRLQLASADLALLARDIAAYGEGAGHVREEVKQMQALLQRLPEGKAKKLAPLVNKADAAVTTLERVYPDVLVAREAAEDFNLRTPQLAAQAAEVVRAMSDTGAVASQINLANRQIVLLDRMSRRVTDILAGGDAAVTAADALQRDLKVYRQVNWALFQGSAEMGVARVGAPAGQAALMKIESLLTDHVADADVVMSRDAAILESERASAELVDIHWLLLKAAPPGY